MEQEKITTTNLNLSPNTPIPVASIDTPARQFTTLPPAPVVAPVTPIIQPESEVKIQEDIKTITPKVDESYKNLLNAMGMTENQGARILEAEQQAGIPTLNKELTDVENEIRQKSLQFRREIERITTTPGLTTAQASARLADVGRKQNSELADLEVIRASRSDSLTNIQNAISRKFELQFADEDRRLKNLETIYDNVKGSLTKAEDRQYDAMIKKEERALDKEKEEAKRVYDLLETAAKNGATRDVLLGISNAKNFQEAITAAGSSLQTPQTDVIKLDNGSTILVDKRTGKIIKDFGGRASTDSTSIANSVFNTLIKSTAALENTVAGKTMINSDLTSYLNNGQYDAAYNQIANSVAQNLPGEVRTRFENARIDREVLTGFRKAIQDFQDAGGDTGLLKGKAEDIQRKLLGVTGDPKLTALAVQLDREFQTYRNIMTGAAFTPEESKEYEKVNPTGRKSFDLNIAIIDGALNQLNNRVEGTIKAKVPEIDTLNKLRKIPQDEATAKKEINSLYPKLSTELQSAIKTLYNNGYTERDVLQYIISKQQ
jgi:hypothetical protein